MNNNQKEEFETYLHEILSLIQENPESEQGIRTILFTFLEDIKKGELLPFRNLSSPSDEDLFQHIPNYRIRLKNTWGYLRSIPSDQKNDIVDIANSFFETAFPKDAAAVQKAGPIEWLKSQMATLVDESGQQGVGRFEVYALEDNTVRVIVEGGLPVQYSARQFLASFYEDPKTAPNLLNPHISQVTYEFALDKARAARREYHLLMLFKELMIQLGYTISLPGKKNCINELFVDASSITQKDEAAMLEQWGINLEVAEALQRNEGNVVFPFTLHLTAQNAIQREQFKTYFKEAGVQNFDKGAPRQKQFILNTYGEESLECNISLPQAKILWGYFLRLDVISKKTGISAEMLRGEAILKKNQAMLRGDMLQNIKDSFGTSHASSLRSFFGAAAVEDKSELCPEDKFEEKFEQCVNQTFICGPEAFCSMLTHSENASELAIAINQTTAALERVSLNANTAQPCSFAEAYKQSAGQAMDALPYIGHSNDYPQTRGQNPIEEYLVAMAQLKCPELLKSIPMKDDKINALLRQGYADLESNIPGIENFLKLHSPYYFVRAVADNIERILNSDEITDEAIEQVLRDHGVTDLKQYKIQGMDVFNIYQIKFDLLKIACDACIKNGILVPFKGFNNAEWGNSAKDQRNWIIAIEWRLNACFKLNWVASKDQRDLTSKSHTKSLTSTQLTALAGTTRSKTASMFVESDTTSQNTVDSSTVNFTPNG